MSESLPEPTPEVRRPMTREFAWIVAGLCVIVLAHLLFSFWHRWDYGFDLEWMEGGMLVHVDRLRQSQGLYVEPSADFVPYIYPPLYPWVLSVLGEPSYAVGRSVSILGTFAAMAAAVYAVRQERMAWPFALAPVALYASCYEDSGAFFDLVRSDAFALGLASWSLVLIRDGRSRKLVIGALLLVLAYMAKHNYAAFGLPMVLWLWRFRGRATALRFAAISAGTAGAWTAYMAWSTDGLFLTYLVEVPSVHPLVGERFFPGAEKEIYGAMPTMVWCALGAGIALLIGREGGEKEGLVYWTSIGVLGLFLCALMRAHHGGFLNVLMPGYWLLALLSCMVLGALAQQGRPLIACLLLVFATGWDINKGLWSKDKYTPTAEDVAAGERLIERIAEYPGDVLMPHAPWYPVLAGKKPSLPLIALWDIDHRAGPLRHGVKDFREAVAARRWDAIITASRKMRYGISEHYNFAGGTGVTGSRLRTKSGWPVNPTRILEPKPASASD